MTGLNILNRITLLDSKSARLIKEFLDAYFMQNKDKPEFSSIERLEIIYEQTNIKLHTCIFIYYNVYSIVI